MKIAYRLRHMGWMGDNTTTLDDLFNLSKFPSTTFIMRNQKEYDILRGYELIYGVRLSLSLTTFDPERFSINEVFLWVDFPNNPD